jgi:hypothetical protein
MPCPYRRRSKSEDNCTGPPSQRFLFRSISMACDSKILPTMVAGAGGGWRAKRLRRWPTWQSGSFEKASEPILQDEMRPRLMKLRGGSPKPFRSAWRHIRSLDLRGLPTAILRALDHANEKVPLAAGMGGKLPLARRRCSAPVEFEIIGGRHRIARLVGRRFVLRSLHQQLT